MMIRLLLLLFVTAYANASSIVNCQYTPKCMDKIDTRGLPITEKDIQEACNGFRQFQECFENWGKQCLSTQQLQDMRANLEKPLQFHKSMCTDENYRNEYLKEQDSIQKIADDWKKCSVELQESFKDVSNSKDPVKMLKHMCCSTKNFDKCTDDICEGKCSSKGSSIVENLIKGNLEALGPACMSINLSDCPEYSSKSSHVKFSLTALIFMMIVQMLIR